MINAVFIGLETEFKAKKFKGGEEVWTDTTWFVVESTFLVIFLFELFLRLRGNGIRASARDNWILFDIMLILMGIFDTWLLRVGGLNEGNMGRFFRMVQLLRLLRVLRVIRLFRFFKELTLLAQGIAGALRALCWALLLIALVLYVGSVLLTQMLGGAAGKDEVEIKIWFGSVGSSLFTLFQLMTLEDWPGVVRGVMVKYPYWWIFFVPFMMVTNFAMLNVVTAIVVERVFAIVRAEAAEEARREEKRRNVSLRKLKQLFEEIDSDGSKEIDLDEFREALQDPQVVARFMELGIPKYQADDLFACLDVDGSQSLSIAEFIDGCLRVQGVAQSKHLLQVQYDICRAREAMQADLNDLGWYVRWVIRHLSLLYHNDSRHRREARSLRNSANEAKSAAGQEEAHRLSDSSVDLKNMIQGQDTRELRTGNRSQAGRRSVLELAEAAEAADCALQEHQPLAEPSQDNEGEVPAKKQPPSPGRVRKMRRPHTMKESVLCSEVVLVNGEPRSDTAVTKDRFMLSSGSETAEDAKGTDSKKAEDAKPSEATIYKTKDATAEDAKAVEGAKADDGKADEAKEENTKKAEDVKESPLVVNISSADDAQPKHRGSLCSAQSNLVGHTETGNSSEHDRSSTPRGVTPPPAGGGRKRIISRAKTAVVRTVHVDDDSSPGVSPTSARSSGSRGSAMHRQRSDGPSDKDNSGDKSESSSPPVSRSKGSRAVTRTKSTASEKDAAVARTKSTVAAEGVARTKSMGARIMHEYAPIAEVGADGVTRTKSMSTAGARTDVTSPESRQEPQRIDRSMQRCKSWGPSGEMDSAAREAVVGYMEVQTGSMDATAAASAQATPAERLSKEEGDAAVDVLRTVQSEQRILRRAIEVLLAEVRGLHCHIDELVGEEGGLDSPKSPKSEQPQ
eukprot:gnl/TRDRNA2_/TRDRNA2_153068_c1_seq5.p1 gnl/TRDRNA2_/TRDRNA2_153068_c1~~gnl/TRDRNA2_/TRDRNA2_153068_c1_seq5.p1  ORF type:complete len:915 (+),score=202.27 gnl/TRDRNA2_/TRDRNA2_153068_c1_seq5:27-2747(+)